MTSLNGVRKGRLTAKETSIANCEVLDEKYRIAVQGIFSVGINIKAGGLRSKTGCFPSLFVKIKPGKLETGNSKTHCRSTLIKCDNANFGV